MQDEQPPTQPTSRAGGPPQPPRPTPRENLGSPHPTSPAGKPPPENIPTRQPPKPQQPPPTPPPPRPQQASPPKPATPPLRPKPQPYDPEQKREFLERGEVRTMQKDIAHLREEEAKKEQRRIAQLRNQQQSTQDQDAVRKIRLAALETKEQEEQQHQEHLRKIKESILPPGEERRIRNLPPPPSRSKKVLVRSFLIIFFAFIALNVALFGYWYLFKNQGVQFDFPFQIPFFSQQEEEPEPITPPSPQPPPPPPPPPQPSPSPISDLLNPSSTDTLRFSGSSDLTSLLAQFIQAQQQVGYTEIIFQDTQQGTSVSEATEFFNIFGIQLPSSVSPIFEDPALFFVYTYERGSRFGLITPVQNSATAAQILQQWEPRMEQDLAPLQPFWGTPGTGYTSSFRTAVRNNVTIRFQTFSIEDQGLVYAFVDGHLILASSFEAVQDAIGRLQSSASSQIETKILGASDNPALFKPPEKLSLQEAVGQTLLIGFEGTTLTPELKLLIERLHPGGVLLLGHNIENTAQLTKLTADLQDLSLLTTALPLFIAVDQEGGEISRIEFGEEKTAQSAIDTTDQAYEVGQARAEELTSLGVNLNLSPVLDTTGPQDFIFNRTFQTGSFQAGRLAEALLAGQRSANILSALKHFPGYGSIPFNPEQKLAVVQELPDISPFVFALSARPEFLLLSNVIYSTVDPDKPFSFSEKGISIVRSDLAFEHVILSDDLSQPSLLENYTLEEIGTSPLRAGINMIIISDSSIAEDIHAILQDQVLRDPLLKNRVEQSAELILDLKKEFFFPKEQQNYGSTTT